MKVSEARRLGRLALSKLGDGGAGRSADWLLSEVLACSRANLVACPERQLSRDEDRRYRSFLARHSDGEPIQYITGWAYFRGLRLKVSPAVLIPRPETELVVDEALGVLDGLTGNRLLDIGTGSGCIALSVKLARPGVRVTACDRSSEALHIAEENKRLLDADVHLLKADYRAVSFCRLVGEGYDLVVSNPPYVSLEERDSLPSEVREHEPPGALYTRGIESYELIMMHVGCVLRPGGWIVFEVHEDRASAVADLMRSRQLEDVAVRADLSGKPRVARGRRSGLAPA